MAIMDKREFDNHIKSGKPINSVLLFGACDYLADYYADLLLQGAGDGADIMKAYFDEYSFETAKNFLSQNSLFGDKLCLIIKTDKKIPKQEAKELILASNKNDAIFIYRYLGDMSGRDEEYFKSFDQKLHAFHIRFFNPSSSREGAVYLEESAARQNIQIDKEALIELVELKSLDLQEAAKELEKLSMLGTKITVQDIKKYVDGSSDEATEKLFDDILAKKEFFGQLSHILEKGELDETRVILYFEGYIYEMLLFLLYSKAYGEVDSIKITGRKLPDFVVRQKASKAVKLNIKHYAKILDILSKADLKLKSSNVGDKNAILINALMKIQSNL